MQLSKNITSTISLLITFFMVGAGIGFAIGFSIDFLSLDSIFTPWKLLESPVKFSQIIDVNFKEVVWAQTSDGKLYSSGSECYINYSKACKKWTETNAIPDNAHERDPQPVSISKNCTAVGELPAKSPPGKIIECASTFVHNGPRTSLITYVLLDDGTIWYWLPPPGTDFPIITMRIGPSIGAILGLIIGVSVIVYRSVKKNPLSTN